MSHSSRTFPQLGEMAVPLGQVAFLPEPVGRWLLSVGCVSVLYFLAARLGLLLAFAQTNASPVWPPSGIGFAAVILLGFRVWPGIMLGAFSANLVAFLGNETSPLTEVAAVSFVISIGNTLEAVSGWYLLRGMIGSRRPLARAPDACRFVAVALLMCLVSSLIGPTGLCLSGIASWTVYGTVWFTWWLGDVVGVLIVTPVFLVWYSRSRIDWPPPRAVEVAISFTLLFATAQGVFGGWIRGGIAASLAYSIIPLLLWPAFRFGQREACMAVGMVSAIAVWGAVHQAGPFVASSRNTSLILLQGFLGVVAITVLVLTAAIIERRELQARLQDALTQMLSGFLPICCRCKSIRDERDNWTPVERYVRDHSRAEFSHGICPDCLDRFYADL